MKKILDYGCGRGYLAHYLANRKDSEVHGVDISEDNINFAKQHFSKPIFCFAPSLPLSYPDNNFDEVYLMDVLEHVDDLNATANEVTRITRPGGILKINVPAEASEKWLLKVRPTYHKEIHHVRIFQKGQMEALFQERGFRLMRKKSDGFLENFALYYLFITAPVSSTQLSVGDWNSSLISKMVYAVFLLFSKKVLTTRLRFFPIWIVTLPIGMLINVVGDKFFPKSEYYEFVKNR